MTSAAARWRIASPFVAAVGLAYLLDFGMLSLGAALGVAAFVALLLAQRPVSIKLGALALASAFALGLSAAIFSALLGQSVLEMVANLANPVGVLLAIAALTLAVLGGLCVAWGVLVQRRE